MPVSFGDFSLDRDRRLLLRGEESVPLARKAFDLLDLLVTQRPRAVSKERIRDQVWPKTVVSESTLNSLVSEVRSALSEDAGSPRYIRTVHGFGYAFVADARDDAPRGLARPVVSPVAALLTARLLWEDRIIPLSPGENLLGRDEDVNVRIDAPSVSRRHARLLVTAGEPATLEDLGSKNGTWVREERLATGPVPLRDGVVLRLGKVELVFLDSREKGPTQTAVD